MIFTNFSPKLNRLAQLNFRIKNRKFSFLSGVKTFEYVSGGDLNPATMFAHTLETIHSVSGFGWPATIISFTLGMRMLIFPAFVKQTKATIMANNLKDEVNGYQTRIQNLRANNQFPEAKRELQEMYIFLRKNNCHPIRTILLSLLPIPLFMSTFFALRNMARQPIESFIDGGAWWFINLAESDPTFILPIISCASLLASFEVSRKSNPSAIPGKMVNILRVLSLVSVPILAYMPSSLCIYFTTTNIFTLFQNIALCIPKVRSILGIPSLLKISPQANVSSGFIENFKKAFNNLKSTQKNESPNFENRKDVTVSQLIDHILKSKDLEPEVQNLFIDIFEEMLESNETKDRSLTEQLHFLKDFHANLNVKYIFKKIIFFNNSEEFRCRNNLLLFSPELLTEGQNVDPIFLNEFDLTSELWPRSFLELWISLRIVTNKHSILSNIKIPRCRSGDQNAISKFCAHYYLDLENVLELVSFNSTEVPLAEKISYFRRLMNKPIDHTSNDAPNRSSNFAFLISELFMSKLSINENLLLIAKSLKLNIKQIFQFNCPELFYQLLIVGGKLFRTGSDLTELFECLALLPENIFENYSKPYVTSVLREARMSITKFIPENYIDFLYSFGILFRFSSIRCFFSLIYQIQESFSYSIQNYGGLLLPTLKECLEKLITECLQQEKIHHFSSLLHISSKIGLFNELTNNNPFIRARFSTHCSITLLDFLSMNSSEFRFENFNTIFKECTEIIEKVSHQFKKLAVIGIEKLFRIAVENSEECAQRIIDWKFDRSSVLTVFPFFIELQNISHLSHKSDVSESQMRFYSDLYLRSALSDGLLDILLVFISALIEKAQIAKNTNSLKAYEYCMERLLFLSKYETSSFIVKAYPEFFTIPDEPANWEQIFGSLTDIDSPSSFSEWVFCVTSKSFLFSKGIEGDLLSSFLPAMIDPFAFIPILPIFIVTAFFSSGGTFIKEYFKPTILAFLESGPNTSRAISIMFDILNEVFHIFSRSFEISGIENSDNPTWLNQFSIEELFVLFRKSINMNILKYAEFFMQLIWSIDPKKISNTLLFDTFTRLDDYRSALCINSTEIGFGVERALYYFLANHQNSLAEAAMSMVNSESIEGVDTIFIKNNSLKMNRELFAYNFENISRISPQKIQNLSNIKTSLQSSDYLNLQSKIQLNPLNYEHENSLILKNTTLAPKSLPWDNFRLLNESKQLRKLRDFENSYYLISRMKIENDPFWTFKHFLELGNWFHSSGKFNIAVEVFQSLAKDQKNPKLLSKIYRKLAASMISSRHFSDQEIIDIFEKSSNLDKNCAKVSFEIGIFYDSLEESPDRTCVVLKNYARALLTSRKYDHLIYPRFITIWLNVKNKQIDKKVNDLMSRFINVASTSQAVNHLSQLISRIGHPKSTDALLIENFLIKIFYDYSDISLWKMGSVAHSTNELRKLRITMILDKVTPGVKNFDIKGFLEFCRLLITICEMASPTDALKISLSKEMRTCKRIMSNDMLIAAPNSTLVYSPENKEGYDYIRGFEDHCIALPSMQRPKKIRFILNNSKHMTALLKPKDDLRKDCRFMELCRFLNLNFAKLKERYEIKIYAVTPLSDECGIIEWVENTASFRSILLKSYKKLGVSIAIRDLKDILAMQISPYEKFVKFFLPKFQPIFMRWFFEKFPSVIKWRAAIQTYTISSAVMSMVGFIIGLGDRHGENILFDETTGGCVHVDFNCLFDKGKVLEYPEKVPFRLTQNLEHACGAGGINSTFKSSCFAIMNMLWDSKRSINTNLETFVHDPLVEWSKSKRLMDGTSDITNEQAQKILKIVERKLSGYIETENYSCEGQVEKLIQHAIDKKNLRESTNVGNTIDRIESRTVLKDLSCDSHKINLSFKVPCSFSEGQELELFIAIYEVSQDDEDFKFGTCHLHLNISHELQIQTSLLRECKSNTTITVLIGDDQCFKNDGLSNNKKDHFAELDQIQMLLTRPEKKIVSEIKEKLKILQ